VGIDSLGDVAGNIEDDTAYRAFVWSPLGQTTLLKPTYPYLMPFGPRGCGASAMSSHGYVVGNCQPDLDNYIAEWAPGATDTLRTTCCNGIDGNALAVTDNQYLTGYVRNFNPPQAFLWRPGQPTYDIIGYYGGMPEVSIGLAVNSSGWVAGWGLIGPTLVDTVAVVWIGSNGGQTGLSHYGQATGIDDKFNARPPGSIYTGGESAAVAINSVHQILGSAIDKNAVKHTVIWTSF